MTGKPAVSREVPCRNQQLAQNTTLGKTRISPLIAGHSPSSLVTMTSPILHNPHPRIQDVNASEFDYERYPFVHCTAKLSAPGVLLITLNRPNQLNAFTNAQCHSLVFLYELADKDDRVRVVVLTGAGKAFCAGADLSGDGPAFGVSPDLPSPILDHRDGGGQLVLAMLKCRKLIIAAVNGNAVGIGLTMTFPADLRLCTQGAKLGVPFVKRGIACDAVSSYLLPRLVGHSRANALILMGDLHPPTSPLLSSLFYSTHPDGPATQSAALTLATRLAKENSVASVAICKDQIWRGSFDGGVGAGASAGANANGASPLTWLTSWPSKGKHTGTPEYTHVHESAALAWCALHGDAKEGVKSFFEKRKPQFTTTLGDLEKSGSEWYPWWNALDVSGKCTRGKGDSKL